MELCKKNRYYNLDVYKFVATIVIALIHFGHTNIVSPNMQIFVEYFFMVSGAFLAKSWMEKNDSPCRYALKRYLALMPLYFLFMCCYFILIFLKGVYKNDLSEFLYWGRHSVLSFLGLQVLGIKDYGHNFGATWFLSVLIVAGVIVYTLCYRVRTKREMALIIMAIVGYTYIFLNNGKVYCAWDSTHGILSNLDFIRGGADLCLGASIYILAINKTRIECASLIELLLFCSAFFISRFTEMTWVVLFMFAGSLYFGLRNSMFDNSFYKNKVIGKLTTLGYPIYLFHPLFVDFGIIQVIPIGNAVKVIIFLVLTFLAALGARKIVGLFSNLKKNLNISVK